MEERGKGKRKNTRKRIKSNKKVQGLNSARIRKEKGCQARETTVGVKKAMKTEGFPSNHPSKARQQPETSERARDRARDPERETGGSGRVEMGRVEIRAEKERGRQPRLSE